jgi:hypothetical protein
VLCCVVLCVLLEQLLWGNGCPLQNWVALLSMSLEIETVVLGKEGRILIAPFAWTSDLQDLYYLKKVWPRQYFDTVQHEHGHGSRAYNAYICYIPSFDCLPFLPPFTL